MKKKGGERKIYGFRKKLMIPESKISECPEHEVKSRKGNISVTEKILEEYSVKIYETDYCFYEHYRKKKYKLMKMVVNIYYLEWMFFFSEYLLAVEIDGKGHTDRNLIFEEKRQKSLEKELGCKFIRINTSKDGYDADYEASIIQTFISQFKDRRLRKLNKKIKELEDKIQKFTSQTIQ